MANDFQERAITFACGSETLLGILHSAEPKAKTGVVIVVAGGPQYRVGAHRQFVTLSREIARLGFPVLRFDHRGIGDSDGDYRGFKDMDDDIRAAIDILLEQHPSIDNVALWGECESASAIAYYAHRDTRVKGLFMVNPWVYTEAGRAKTYLKHYYLQRLFQVELWKRIFSGDFQFKKSIQYFFFSLLAKRDESKSNKGDDDLSNLPLTTRLMKSMLLYQGSSFVMTSGHDYIAQEFKGLIAHSEDWKEIVARGQTRMDDIPDADHTFSRPEWRTRLFDSTKSWVAEIGA